MTECQGCGAWNDASRTLCVLCGTPLAGTDEWDPAADPPPLPPLPDGGLAAAMPHWLREPPSLPAHPGGARPLSPPVADLPPLGPRADPRTFLTDDDFPRWLRDLAAREVGGRRREVAGERREADEFQPDRLPPAAPAIWPHWPETAEVASRIEAAPPLTPAVPASERRLAPSPAPARASEERRGHGGWETLLLVLLFFGVLAAALWALVSNGVLGPGL